MAKNFVFAVFLVKSDAVSCKDTCYYLDFNWIFF